MAVDMFLKIEGVDGEARDKEHKGEIDVLAWSWGMSQAGTAGMGGGGGAGKVDVQNISLTKYIDLATEKLWLSCANGKHFDSATLTMRKAGENPLEYIVFTMEQVMVTSTSTGGSGGEDRITENVTLDFSKFEMEYKSQKKDGTEDKKKKFAWDIAENAKA